MMFFEKKKKSSVGKVIGITTAAVAGACAVSYFVYRLVLKLKEKEAEYEEDLCEGCPLADECDGECPIEELVEETVEEEVAEEAPAEAPAEQ